MTGKQDNKCVFLKAVYKHTIQAQDGRETAGLGSITAALKKWSHSLYHCHINYDK